MPHIWSERYALRGINLRFLPSFLGASAILGQLSWSMSNLSSAMSRRHRACETTRNECVMCDWAMLLTGITYKPVSELTSNV